LEQPTIQNLSAPKVEFVEPPQSSKPIIASSYELCPSFRATTTLDPLDDEFLRESIRELTSIMSNEWVEEVEFSPKKFIFTPLHQPFNAKLVDLGKMYFIILL